MSDTASQLLLEHEVLAITKCSSRTIARWVGRKLFPAPINPPGTKNRLWRREDIEQWAAPRGAASATQITETNQ
jgi:predicted DNA-binding transcriptional regulator AlpA